MGPRSTSRERGRRALGVSWKRSASPSGWPDIAHFAPSPLEPSNLASVVSIRKWLSSTPPAPPQDLSSAGSPARAVSFVGGKSHGALILLQQHPRPLAPGLLRRPSAAAYGPRP